jgi:hypothetical protein
VAQLVNVHSVLRLNYETLRGLISLASPSVAKLTLCETVRCCFLRRIYTCLIQPAGVGLGVSSGSNSARMLPARLAAIDRGR